MKKLSLYILTSTFILASCGGGGGGGGGGGDTGGGGSYTPAPTINFSSSSTNGYQYESTTINWSSTNATSCNASGDWLTTGSKGTSGSESYTFDVEGSYTFGLSCTGSGGTTTATSITIQAFIYENVNNEVTDYTWDGFAMGQIIYFTSSSYNNVYSDSWVYFYDDIGWTNQAPLTFEVVEPSESTLNLSYSGESYYGEDLNLSLNFNGWNTSETPLYEYGNDDPTYALLDATFSDLNVSIFAGYPTYMESIGIEYMAAAQIIAETPDGLKGYLLPTFYGDYTETSDLPTGTSSMTFQTMNYYHEQEVGSSSDDTYEAQVAVGGTGNLNFDYDAGTLSGDVTLNNWMVLSEFLAGNGPNAQITSIANLNALIVNGQITGNRFQADIEYRSSSTNETIDVGVEPNNNGSGNVYVIDGVQKKSLTLNAGTTYTFNHSQSHPLRFSTTSDGTHVGGSEYTYRVDTSAGVTTIEVTSSTPKTLYYYCDVHSGMGSDITTVQPEDYFDLTGTVTGALFGPAGKEVGLSMIFYNEGQVIEMAAGNSIDIAFGAGVAFGEQE
jgi:plastocyanin